MKKSISIIFLLFCVVIGVFIGTVVRHADQTTSPVTLAAQRIVYVSNSPSISLTPTPGIPKTIFIPAIHLLANIEPVSVDAENRMDVPKKAMDAGWYSPGFRPGSNGNAVLDGHLDKVTGAPAVFWDVTKLTAGDKIIITDENNKTYTFVVTKQVSYPYNNLPLSDIFSASTTPHLNLITCNGTWDKVNKNYSNRIVVYADLQK